MLRRDTLLALTVLLIVTCGSPARAQTPGAATGNIDITITDAQGSPLLGVSIVITGEALMGAMTRTSGLDGAYRVSGVPPGAYALKFSLSGFQSKKLDKVAVAIGATAGVNVILEKLDKTLTYEELVVVEGGVRTVDRHATTLTTNFTGRELAHVPGSRVLQSLYWLTPAAYFTRNFDVGGSHPVSQFTAYGTGGLNMPTIEGINIAARNPFAFEPDFGTFAEVSVGSGAYGPEWQVPSIHIQVVTRSGGNAYHGIARAAYEHGTWQSHNVDAEQEALGAAKSAGVRAREANRLAEYHDVSADVGGFLMPDRVWWYGAVRHMGRSARQVLFPIEPIESTTVNTTVKSTIRLTDRQHVVVYGQYGRNREPIRLAGFLFPTSTINTSRESTAAQAGHGLMWKTEWNAAIRNNMVAEIRGGQFGTERAERPNGSSPRSEDRATSQVLGGHRDWQEDWQNDQLNGALSFLAGDWLGQHHLKFGGEVQRIIAGERWNRSFPGDVLHELSAGRPHQVYLFQTPSHSRSGIWLYEAYASDSWQVNGRLTLNLGLRFDRIRPFLPAQEHRAVGWTQSFAAVNRLAAWNLVAPRLGASLDLTGDGRTIAKFNYGLYWLSPGVSFGFNLNPNQPEWWELFTWSDHNHSGVWEPGEQGKDRLDYRGGEASDALDPGLRLPYIREAAARVEREIIGDFNVSTGVLWRGERQQGARQVASWRLEDFKEERLVPDPGPDSKHGNADDGPLIHIRDVPLEVSGQSATIVRNLEFGNSEYFTWEVTARRRYRSRWSLLAWFSTTWNRDHAREFFGQAVRANEFPVTPNDFIQTDAQGRHRYRVWAARILATYEAPWSLRITPFLAHQSGQPFGRTLTVRMNDGSNIRVLTEPVGTRRQDNVTLFDLQVEKDVLNRRRGRLTAYVEVFNMLNANPANQVNWSPGGERNPFLRPIAIVPPRIARIGFRLDW